METVKTVYLGELRTKSVHLQSGNEIITDAPKDNQGKGEAFSPTDLLATSLGCCMISIIGIAARTHSFDITGTEIKTTKIMAADPRRVAEIVVELFFPHNNYGEKEKKIIEYAVKTCPVALSLHPDVKQTIRIHYL
jgi:putative redox protein